MTLTFKPVVEETTTLEEDVQTAERAVVPRQDVAVAEPVQAGPGGLLQAIVQLASNPDIDVAKLSALMEMQERMEARDAERQFNEAMFRVQSKLKPMVKQGVVKLGRGESAGSYTYLRREDLDDELRPIAAAEGFSWSFTQKPAASGAMTVYIHVRHVAGHTQTSEMELPADTGPGRSPLQARVSTISFCERVLTEMAFNIVRKGSDDNGVKGGTKYIEEPQVLEIQTLAIETNTEEGRFLEMMTSEARSFEEVEVKDFARLVNALISKRRQMAARRPTGEMQ